MEIRVLLARRICHVPCRLRSWISFCVFLSGRGLEPDKSGAKFSYSDHAVSPHKFQFSLTLGWPRLFGRKPKLRTHLLPLSPPNLGEEEIAEVLDTLRSDWITTGPKTRRFEQEFAAALDAPGCLALNSCTAALHLALVILGIGPGDAVITTPMTFCSTVHVIEHVGAQPILVDVEPDTLNISPDKLNEKIEQFAKWKGASRCLKAILPVHLYGHPCEMDSLLGIARLHNLAIIEDAAHALPARYKGRLIGSHRAALGIPVLTCFSFYATKNMTTAEGGMLAGPAEAIEEARVRSLHGMSRDAWRRYGSEGSWFYDVTCAGFKYNMTDIQAAIGLHQLARLSSFHTRRKEIADRYNEAFSQFDTLQIPAQHANVDHAWHLYVLRLNLDLLRISRSAFINELRQRNIASSVHFIPIHLHRYYREKYGYRPADFPVAYREYERMISLPLHSKMSDQDAEDVISAVSDIVRKHQLCVASPRAATARPRVVSKLPEAASAAVVSDWRLFDLLCAAAGLAFLAPLFALIALAIKFDDGGPVFYSQWRIGKGLRKFRLLKFRTMIPHSDGGSLLTRSGDPRVTRIGRFLRRYKLDELPQLLNVLKGEMRLVGVRPQVERYVECYPVEYAQLLCVPPGITDLACLTFRHEEELFRDEPIEQQYVEKILPAKLEISLNYLRDRTFFSDLDILFRTVLGLKNPSGSSRKTIPGVPLQPLSKFISRDSS
jgi:dTDP-4-amino-4,6-dideoxygalactose transaminase/lipopolysaccharide/colanic/teichoic acid biosynthesis glycosyltransferase